MSAWDECWAIARDRGRGNVLIGGVGFAGDGTMWTKADEIVARTRGFDEAPEDPNREDDFGWTSRTARML